MKTLKNYLDYRAYTKSHNLTRVTRSVVDKLQTVSKLDTLTPDDLTALKRLNLKLVREHFFNDAYWYYLEDFQLQDLPKLVSYFKNDCRNNGLHFLGLLVNDHSIRVECIDEQKQSN